MRLALAVLLLLCAGCSSPMLGIIVLPGGRVIVGQSNETRKTVMAPTISEKEKAAPEAEVTEDEAPKELPKAWKPLVE